MEDAMLDKLVNDAANKGIDSIIGYYFPTPKNGMVKDFYCRMGFEKIAEDAAGNTTWKLDLKAYQPKNSAIEIHNKIRAFHKKYGSNFMISARQANV